MKENVKYAGEEELAESMWDDYRYWAQQYMDELHPVWPFLHKDLKKYFIKQARQIIRSRK
jgi:hypothetical protein